MATYKIDPTHSEITFKVKHLLITNVSGDFKKFDASFEAEKEDFSDAVISFEADIDSIDTKQEQRDGHLKSADFFDAANHPKLTFHSTQLVPVKENEYKLIGDLTIKGITNTVELDVEFGGTAVDFYGQTKVGFEINGKIERSKFGLTWSAVTEAGGVVVSDDVKLHIEAQFVKQ
jgi:polyisoprenoid-binding protein YceI